MNTKYFILILGIVLHSYLPLFSQDDLWYLTRGNMGADDSWGVNVDDDGSVYWTTVHKNPAPYGFFDIYLYKYTSDGQQIWQSNPYGGNFNDVCFPVKILDDYVYIAGRTDSDIFQTQTDPLYLCYDKNSGILQWDLEFDPFPDFGYEEIDGLSIQPDGIYATGWSLGPGANNMNVIIQKISLSGQPIWSKTWDYGDFQKHDGANGHLVIDDKHIYIAAHVNKTNLLSNDGDAALVCFNRNDGSYLWHVLWGKASWDHGLGLTMSKDSMLYMVGHTGSYGNLQQFFINKYNRNGQLNWSRLWGGAGAELSRAVITDGDSIIYAAGTTTSYGNGEYDLFVLKYDSAGTLIDSLFWGGTKKEQCRDAVFHDGYLFVAGLTESFHYMPEDTASDAFLLKLNGRSMRTPDMSSNLNVSSLSSESDFIFYPNPASDFLHCKRPDNSINDEWIITITDMTGKNLISTLSDKSIEDINICALRSGLYLVQVKTKDGNFTNKRIIKL